MCSWRHFNGERPAGAQWRARAGGILAARFRPGSLRRRRNDSDHHHCGHREALLPEWPIVACAPSWHDRSQTSSRGPRPFSGDAMPSPIRSSESLDVDALLAALPGRIADVPARWAAQSPAHQALIEDARRLSYGDLAQAVDAAAAMLAGLGVQGGDRVMIVAENCVAQIVLLFAAARVDAWALVSNARLS
ncbi:AMP-binding protein, partial [Burkholderia stabilis]